MSGGNLSPLQTRVVKVVAAVEPHGALTGGAALIGFYLRHRHTRDLDFFWHGCRELGDVSRLVDARLFDDSLAAEVVQTSSSFRRLRVSDGADTVIVDLVADPTETIETPRSCEFEGRVILVDSPHEILVNKLCALLGRVELRDLQDVRALLTADGDLVRAVADAPRKDAGFSALTLAWVLKGMKVPVLARVAGLGPPDADQLAAFQTELVNRLAAMATPE
jgi:hypothetical protein